jgi:hypothetical protein
MNKGSLRTLIIFSLLALIVAPQSAHAADAILLEARPADHPLGTYKIDFVPIITNLGVPTLDESSLRNLTNQVDEVYKDSTNGQIHFVFNKILPPEKDGAIQYVDRDDIKNLEKGFAGVLIVGVNVYDPLTTAGAAGSYVGADINGVQNLTVDVLSHEFGHSFGLLHANSGLCDFSIARNGCSLIEYGDYSDLMGRNTFNERFSASLQDLLGLLKDGDTRKIVTSGNYDIAPAYSYGSGKPKVLYVPIYNQNVFSIEYRPSTGRDAGGPNSAITSGVQIRILAWSNGADEPLLPKKDDSSTTGVVEGHVSHVSSAVLVDPSNNRQGYDVGKTIRLSDGSSITIISANPETGVQVHIDRPVDTQPPKIVEGLAHWISPPYPVAVDAVGSPLPLSNSSPFFDLHDQVTTYVYPENGYKFGYWIAIPISLITDNIGIASVQMVVNGQVVSKLEGKQTKSQNILAYIPSKIGTFEVHIIATDFAGNESISASQSFQVQSSRALPLPAVEVNPGSDPYHSLIVTVTNHTNEEIDYELSNLTSGTISSIDRGTTKTTFTVSGLTPNSSFGANVSGTNSIGVTDGGINIGGTTAQLIQNILTVTPKSKITISCVKGKVLKRVSGLSPKCPAGYRVKK